LFSLVQFTCLQVTLCLPLSRSLLSVPSDTLFYVMAFGWPILFFASILPSDTYLRNGLFDLLFQSLAFFCLTYLSTSLMLILVSVEFL
jgi:hypothetical protein